MYAHNMIFENKKIVVPQDDKRVLYQLSYLKRAYTEEGKLKVKVDEGTKDDHADALALACNAVSFGEGWYYVEHTRCYTRIRFNQTLYEKCNV